MTRPRKSKKQEILSRARGRSTSHCIRLKRWERPRDNAPEGEAKSMLTNAAFLKGLSIQATDGELGTVDQFYFDDETWAIRYLTVETGGWLGGRSVLISPISVVHTDWPAKRLDVSLTKKQV